MSHRVSDRDRRSMSPVAYAVIAVVSFLAGACAATIWIVQWVR